MQNMQWGQHSQQPGGCANNAAIIGVQQPSGSYSEQDWASWLSELGAGSSTPAQQHAVGKKPESDTDALLKSLGLDVPPAPPAQGAVGAQGSRSGDPNDDWASIMSDLMG